MAAESAEGFSEAPYLEAEFAVLRAMRGETRDVNNRQSHQSRVTEKVKHRIYQRPMHEVSDSRSMLHAFVAESEKNVT